MALMVLLFAVKMGVSILDLLLLILLIPKLFALQHSPAQPRRISALSYSNTLSLDQRLRHQQHVHKT